MLGRIMIGLAIAAVGIGIAWQAAAEMAQREAQRIESQKAL